MVVTVSMRMYVCVCSLKTKVNSAVFIVHLNRANAVLGPNNAALLQAYKEMVTAGDKNLHYVTAEQQYAKSTGGGFAGPLSNPTVGGCHPSDLGANDVASFYAEFLPEILGS